MALRSQRLPGGGVVSGGGRGLAFTPFEEQRPPSGFYDPALDAQERAARRGLAQLLADTDKAGQRSETDYLLGTGDVQRQAGQTLADLLRDRTREGQDFTASRARGQEDFGTRRTRGQEDHDTSIADISRSFRRLGEGQAQAASAAGLGAGAFAAARDARVENEGLARKPVETGFRRFTEDTNRDEGRFFGDLDQRHSRFLADSSTQEGRVGEARDLQLGELGRQFGYGVVDRGDAARRAQLENQAFGQDIGAQRLFQAGQAGYVAPKGPANEFRDAQGNPYRVVIRGNRAVRVNPQGGVISSRPRAGR